MRQPFIRVRLSCLTPTPPGKLSLMNEIVELLNNAALADRARRLLGLVDTADLCLIGSVVGVLKWLSADCDLALRPMLLSLSC